MKKIIITIMIVMFSLNANAYNLAQFDQDTQDIMVVNSLCKSDLLANGNAAKGKRFCKAILQYQKFWKQVLELVVNDKEFATFKITHKDFIDRRIYIVIASYASLINTINLLK